MIQWRAVSVRVSPKCTFNLNYIDHCRTEFTFVTNSIICTIFNPNNCIDFHCYNKSQYERTHISCRVKLPIITKYDSRLKKFEWLYFWLTNCKMAKLPKNSVL